MAPLSAAPALGPRAATVFLVPVVARLGDEAVGPEPEHRAASESRFPALFDPRRPPLDQRPVALLEGLAEPDLLLGLGGEGPPRVGEHALAADIGRPERRGVVDRVLGVEGGHRVGVVLVPRAPPAVRPAPGVRAHTQPLAGAGTYSRRERS